MIRARYLIAPAPQRPSWEFTTWRELLAGLPVFLRRLAWAASLALLLATRAAAGDAPLSLPEAVSEALRHNPEAQIAALETGQARDALGEARSVYLPHLWASSNAGYSNRQDEKLRAVDASGQEHTYGLASLGASQGFLNLGVDETVFDWKHWVEVGRSRRGAQAARLAEASRREAVAALVMERYTDVLRLQHHVAVDVEHVQQAQRLSTRAAALAKSGRTLADDVDLVSIGLEGARARLQGQRADLISAREALLEAIGAPVAASGATGAAPLALAEQSLPKPGVLAAPPAAEKDLRQAPDIRLLAVQEEMAAQQVDAARAERYPTVALTGQYVYYGPKRYDNFQDEVRLGIDARMSLFDGLQSQNAIAKAEKALAVARLKRQSALEQKTDMVRALRRRLTAARAASVLYTHRVANAKEHLRLANLRLEAGRGALTEVVDALGTWAQAAHSAVDTHFGEFTLWASLERAQGKLVPALLGPAAAPAGAP